MKIAYPEITLKIANENRRAAACVYNEYKHPFLTQITGAKIRELLIRDDDVQALRGFDTTTNANAYLNPKIFNADVVKGLTPYLTTDPEIRIYDMA